MRWLSSSSRTSRVRANPMIDTICGEGIRLAATALPAAVVNGGDRQARSSMALASLWSGMALANAGLGAVHGFAGPIGGRFPAPHGAICAVLLPHVMRANIRALETRAADSRAVARFTHVARWLTGRPAAEAADGVEWVRQHLTRFGIPSARLLRNQRRRRPRSRISSVSGEQHARQSNCPDTGRTVVDPARSAGLEPGAAVRSMPRGKKTPLAHRMMGRGKRRRTTRGGE